MPTNEDLPADALRAKSIDPGTGRPAGEAQPWTDRDRELAKVREREAWIGAISVPPPGGPG